MCKAPSTNVKVEQCVIEMHKQAGDIQYHTYEELFNKYFSCCSHDARLPRARARARAGPGHERERFMMFTCRPPDYLLYFKHGGFCGRRSKRRYLTKKSTLLMQ